MIEVRHNDVGSGFGYYAGVKQTRTEYEHRLRLIRRYLRNSQ